MKKEAYEGGIYSSSTGNQVQVVRRWLRGRAERVRLRQKYLNSPSSITH